MLFAESLVQLSHYSQMLRKLLPSKRTIKHAPGPTFDRVLVRQYHEQVAQQHIQEDPQQLNVLAHLESLLTDLLRSETYLRQSMPKKLFRRSPKKCRSIYIYGDVGAGKSMLMDLFFKNYPFANKRRIHFHAFMQEIHARLYALRNSRNTPPYHKALQGHKKSADLIYSIAHEISSSVKVLCFDEFHVADIADAMLLGRLFTHLLEAGVVIVSTSNYRPDELYPGGLQRELFLPFIQLLKQKTQILELNSQQDYRLRHLLSFDRRYYYPLTEYADYLIHQSYTKLTNDAPKKPGTLEVHGRIVKLTATHGDIALSSFAELCEQPLGSADYLELAKQFSTLILADIPKLTAELRNETQRFIHLIDILYEHKVILVCSADAQLDELCTEIDRIGDFRRTVSRLIEMQSEAYLQSRHLPT